MFWFFILLKSLCFVLPVLVSVAFLTLLERKIMASMQRRRGPNLVGFVGLLQPFADALKLLSKEFLIPTLANNLIFIFSPITALFCSLAFWVVMPFQYGIVLVDIAPGLMYIFAFSSLSVYAIIMAGWSSNSKYAFLGALRSVAQMISYEVSMGVIIISVVACSLTFNLSGVVQFQREVMLFFPLWPVFFMFFVSILAETNRPPFDLPEAEGELVAGYFVEYSGVGFALFFIAECSNIIFMSFLVVVLFFGGWLVPISCLNFCFFVDTSIFCLAAKSVFFCFLFVWVRASLPRYRYDQLMSLGWKIFLPISLVFVLYVVSILFFFGGFFNYLIF